MVLVARAVPVAACGQQDRACSIDRPYAQKGGNKPTPLPHGTSLFDVRNAMPNDNEIVDRDSLRLFSVPAALVAVSEQCFRRTSTDVRAAMTIVKDASDVLALLLEGGHSTVAGRLAGAFRNAGRMRIADEIVKTMGAAGYTIRETDPFEDKPTIPLALREVSPYVNRIRLLWEAMRQPVLDVFPSPPGLPHRPDAYLKVIDEVYVNDTYHSLSIEGYRVSPELIERVCSGAWSPEQNAEDHGNRNALAARDCMPVLFDLLEGEAEPTVRAVLRHFIFVYIHPYMDGNGRMGRFLMNVTMASGGYPWIIVPVERRDDYMSALESASVKQDIQPFAAFIGDLVEAGVRSPSLASSPQPDRHPASGHDYDRRHHHADLHGRQGSNSRTG